MGDDQAGKIYIFVTFTLSLSRSEHDFISRFVRFLLPFQNLRDQGDVTAGYIGMGDRYGNKNGGIQSFLVGAVNKGARIVEHCRVTRVVTATTAPTSAAAKDQRCRRATGVECVVEGSGALTVHARHAVIVAAGALHTPGLLRQSGLRNRRIGRHLRLHPTVGVLGFYPKTDPIDAILGAPMTTVCNEFARGPAGDGYGAKIECPCAYPGLLGAAMPWISAQTFKDRMLRYRNCVPLVLVQRDSGEGGSVKVARDGMGLTIDYNLNREDKKSLMKAMQGATQILIASGSEEVGTGHVRDEGFKTNGDKVDKDLLQEYVQSIENRGMIDHEIGLFSAHQMGSCRMGISPLSGAVDPNGETWECDDLFVMDTSIFPTSSGSNPMVTALTLSYMLSNRLRLSLMLRDDPDESKARADFSAMDRAKALVLSEQRLLMRVPKHANPIGNLGGIAVLVPLLLALLAGWLTGRFNEWKLSW